MSTSKICLVGNPNSGKTTLFNALTGSRQRVGNWPGVTVEKKTGHYRFQGQAFDVVDLPGVYSLSASARSHSVDVQIACEFISEQQVDVLVNIIDATQLERSLYLTTQLLDMQVPMVLAVNMMDVVKQRGIKLDLDVLSEQLGCPVIPLVSRKRQGIKALKQQLAKTVPVPKPIRYSIGVEMALNDIKVAMGDAPSNAHWQALRMLENDMQILSQWQSQEAVIVMAKSQQERLVEQIDQEIDVQLADERFQVVAHLMQDVRHVGCNTIPKLTRWVDKMALNRWLGIPCFFLVMYLMFQCAISLGGALQPLFDDGSRVIFMDGLHHLGLQAGLPAWLTTVLSQGVGLGLNTVLTFVPQIAGLFLALSFIEDSGYMSRAAFVMDKLMQWVGLPGKAFVPLIIGFGCNVPAIMATRTLETRRDRLLTILISPFMSCGARLAIFAVFSTAFFPNGGALIVFLLYVVGILVALLTGLILRFTILKGRPAPFVMELPAYHLPSLSGVVWQAWHRLRHFVWRAGKVILPVCIIIGSLNSLQWDGRVVPGGSPQSVLAKAGQVITPVFEPIGIHQDNWPATVGLVTGFLAKEVVVGTLNTLYTQDQDEGLAPEAYHPLQGLSDAWQQTADNIKGLLSWHMANPFTANEADSSLSDTAMGNMIHRFVSPMAAFSFMLFVLLYVPCISTVAVTRREAGNGWSWLSMLWSLVIAYSMATLVYQLSTWPSGVASLGWILLSLALPGAMIWGLHRLSKVLPISVMGCGQGCQTPCAGCGISKRKG